MGWHGNCLFWICCVLWSFFSSCEIYMFVGFAWIASFLLFFISSLLFLFSLLYRTNPSLSLSLTHALQLHRCIATSINIYTYLCFLFFSTLHRTTLVWDRIFEWLKNRHRSNGWFRFGLCQGMEKDPPYWLEWIKLWLMMVRSQECIWCIYEWMWHLREMSINTRQSHCQDTGYWIVTSESITFDHSRPHDANKWCWQGIVVHVQSLRS